MANIDRYDIRILEALQENSRIKIADLAQRVALTTTPCVRRIHLMEEAGLIAGYTVLLDQEQVGYPVTVIIELRLGGRSQEVIEHFERKISKLPEVMECYMISGREDYFLKIITQSLDSYQLFLREKILNISGVQNVTSTFVLDKVVDRTSIPLRRRA